MRLKADWKNTLQRLLLDGLGGMGQEEVDAWMGEEFDLAPMMKAAFESMAPYRDMLLREIYQISPSELFDRWRLEHPELVFENTDRAIVRLGSELHAIRSMVQST